MRRIITILLLMSFVNFNLSAIAELKLSENILNNQELIEKAIAPCGSIFSEAAKNSSSKKYVEACECALKQDLSAINKQTQKEFINTIYSVYIVNALDAHKITKKKKYLNKAYKISKKAVKNEVQDIGTLKTSMVISTFKGSPGNTAKAYAQMCEANKSECEAYYAEYDEMYNQSKLQRKENLKWIKTTGLVLLIGLAAFGGAYAGSRAANNNNNNNKNMTCRTVGDTTYCNQY